MVEIRIGIGHTRTMCELIPASQGQDDPFSAIAEQAVLGYNLTLQADQSGIIAVIDAAGANL